MSISREILIRASLEMRTEWKIFLEAVLIEMRAGKILNAIHVAHSAVSLHPGTGRLWAIYIQLCHRYEFLSILKEHVVAQRRSGDVVHANNSRQEEEESLAVNRALFQHDCDTSLEADESGKAMKKAAGGGGGGNTSQWREEAVIIHKDKIIRRAISDVPKSGEVWCEKSRCHLNPLNAAQFDLCQAQRSLCFAIQFTPQYGDSFIEYIRLEMISQVLLPKVLDALGLPYLPFLKKYLSVDLESDAQDINRSNRLTRAGMNIDNSSGLRDSIDGLFAPSLDAEGTTPSYERPIRRQKMIAIETMDFEFSEVADALKAVSLEKLNRRFTSVC